MALRALQGPTGGGAPVGGTGTIDTIPRWTAASTLGDSLLSQSGTIVSAASAFRVQAGTNWATNNGGLLLFSNNGYKIGFDSVGGTVGYIRYQVDTAASALHGHMFSAGALGSPTNLMFIRSDGNVGIGTTSPLAPLDVRDATVSGLGVTSIYTGAITAGQGGALTFGGFFTGTSPTTWSKIVGGKDNATAGEFGGHLQFLTRPNGGSLAERARIDSAGNVGIGTVSPATKLEVVAGTAIPARFATNNGTACVVRLLQSGQREWGIQIPASGTSLSFYDYSAAQERMVIDVNGNVILGTATGATIQAAGTGQGLKLPATPGNADAQTLDCYAETTLNSGFTTSGITSTGTFTVTARATRIGRSIALTVKITPSGGASLTFASGWYVTLTGIPQMPDIAAFAAISNDATGARGSIFCDAAATPTIYGGTAGAYALGTNISLLVSGIVT